MHPNVHCSTVYNSQDMEAASMSIDRGMDKENVVHMYNGLLLSHWKEWDEAIDSNVDAPRECHAEWSISDREGDIYDIPYMWI